MEVHSAKRLAGFFAGVPEAALLESYEPHKGQKPVAIWASSIGQGGVVQNAGMTWISK